MAAQHFVIFHHPGPAWEAGKKPVDQPGVMEHFAYLQGIEKSGAIMFSGPFPSGEGGMMILQQDVERAAAEKIASDDPAIRLGLITAEIRPWLITISALDPSQGGL